MEIVPF